MSEIRLDTLLGRFPIGAQIQGRVSSYLMPGHGVGIFVDLGDLQIGFVDGEHLRAVELWPAVGAEIPVEVLRHDVRRGLGLQIRLWPLDSEHRNPMARHWGFPDQDWARVKRQYPVGSTVTATVIRVSPGNRWYHINFGEGFSLVNYLAEPPAVGTTGRFRITGLLESTHRIIVAAVNLS